MDAHAAHFEELEWLKAKVSDLEDRSRGNNIKIRGISETIPPIQLQQYVKELFSALVLTLSTTELSIDRIHRLLKASFLASEVPRDVLLRVHFYQSKELIISVFRINNTLPEEYSGLQLLLDLSRHTLKKHKNLATITKVLRNHNIPHRWKYPASLSIMHNGSTSLITSMEEGLQALRQWGILPQPSQPANPAPAPESLLTDWQVKSRKRSAKKKNQWRYPNLITP